MQKLGLLLDGWRHGDICRRSALTLPGELRQHGSELGMATAEVAILILVSCGFAAILGAVLGSSEVRGLLTGLVRDALSTR
mgnify:CR=1 FL=1